MASARAAERLQDTALDVSRAVLRIGEPRIPVLVDAVRQFKLLGNRCDESAKEHVSISFGLVVQQLEIEQCDLLAGVESGLDCPHEQRTLAHLSRPLDRHGLSRLADQGERQLIGGAGQIPGILDVERASGHRQRSGIGGRRVRTGGRGGRSAMRLKNRLPAIAASSCVSSSGVSSARPRGILRCIEIRAQGIRQRLVEGDANWQNARRAYRRAALPRELDFTPHHLASTRLGGEEYDQEVGLPNLRFDLTRPGLADNHLLVHENGVASLRQPSDDLPRQRLIRFNVAFVAEKDARSARLHDSADCLHERPLAPQVRG